MTLEQLEKHRKEGTSFWYGRIEFSKKTYRCTKRIKPVEVSIKERGLKDDYYIQLVDKNMTYIYYSALISQLCPDSYETREECIEAYNSEVLNQKDKLQHDTEERMKYLDSKLEKL